MATRRGSRPPPARWARGWALAGGLLQTEFGKDLVDHKTYALVGDGDLMEGISHEAMSLAGHMKLNQLIVLFDDNHVSIDGPTELSVDDDQIERFKAHGWNAERVDGLDQAAVSAALERAQTS